MKLSFAIIVVLSFFNVVGGRNIVRGLMKQKKKKKKKGGDLHPKDLIGEWDCYDEATLSLKQFERVLENNPAYTDQDVLDNLASRPVQCPGPGGPGNMVRRRTFKFTAYSEGPSMEGEETALLTMRSEGDSDKGGPRFLHLCYAIKKTKSDVWESIECVDSDDRDIKTITMLSSDLIRVEKRELGPQSEGAPNIGSGVEVFVEYMERVE